MFKLLSSIAVAALAITAAPAPAQAVGPDAAACRSGRPSILVNVKGFKNRAGKVRVQLYGSNPADFLAKGKKLRRIDIPVDSSGPMQVCIAVPRPGNYAVAVRHDADANGKSGWNDGGGFSRNPDISLTKLRPKHSQVVIAVGNGVKNIDVVLNYRRGLSIDPIV
ncbi:MAG TPA: DUF2141 domain-containing protein [Allosphingosinicella sp.]|uniref:DUF2141 domain-containing protein n=1 Tax=Allosphingosinicella sp. TaxID=2823234 RepID=UPI002ED885BD